jgi:hypothetical protein
MYTYPHYPWFKESQLIEENIKKILPTPQPEPVYMPELQNKLTQTGHTRGLGEENRFI